MLRQSPSGGIIERGQKLAVGAAATRLLALAHRGQSKNSICAFCGRASGDAPTMDHRRQWVGPVSCLLFLDFYAPGRTGLNVVCVSEISLVDGDAQVAAGIDE